MKPKTWDDQTELAKERNRIAADRTLLTWIRTSVSFIGLGFGLGQILDALTVGIQGQPTPTSFIKLLTFLSIGMGTLILIAAALEYQAELRQLQKAGYLYRSRPSLSLVVGVSVAIASTVALIMFWQTPLSP
jgi:putative membrane protein